MDNTQWPQGIGVVKTVEGSGPMADRRAARAQKDQALNCPRCNSINTKFCYYNNYSLSQPRYFCKACRRYWTKGGSLRNVPVGGGSRKNKRSSSSSSSSSPASSKKLGDHDLIPNPPVLHRSAPQNPKIHDGDQGLNLSYPPPVDQDYNSLRKFVQVPFSSCNKNSHQNSSSSSTPTHLNTMELLKTGISSRGLSSFISMPVFDSNTVYSNGFPMQDFKPTVNLPVDGYETGYGNLYEGVQESGARLLFPVEALTQVPTSTTNELEQNRGQGESTRFWSGLLGGGHNGEMNSQI